MEINERHKAILAQLKENGQVKVSELSTRLYVSEATIRRDLEKLEHLGHLNRCYGGAVSIGSLDTEAPLELRKCKNQSYKEHIATVAESLINSGNMISLDSSTSSLYLCSKLKRFVNLTVITHGIKAIEELQNYSNINLYSSGGLMLRGTYSLSGEFTRSFFRSFFTDIAFISCKGISLTHGMSWAYDEEAALRRIMLQNTKRRILLCDSDKFDKTYASTLFSFELIDTVITNKRPSPQWLELFDKYGIEVLY